MGSRRIVRPPDHAVGPILFQLAQKLQHIFLGDRLPVGQKAVPGAGGYAWTRAGLGAVDQHRHFASGDGIGVGGRFVDPAQTGGIGAGGGGAAIRKFSNGVSASDVLNNPNKGGQGSNGKIIIEWWE